MNGLFVVGPHTKHFDGAVVFVHLVDQPMLNVDAARLGACEVAHQLLAGRGTLKGGFRKHCQKLLGLGP